MDPNPPSNPTVGVQDIMSFSAINMMMAQTLQTMSFFLINTLEDTTKNLSFISWPTPNSSTLSSQPGNLSTRVIRERVENP